MTYAQLRALQQTYLIYPLDHIFDTAAETLDYLYVAKSIELALEGRADNEEVNREALQSLAQVLKNRFQYIRHTNWLYTKNNSYFVNQFCIELAKVVQAAGHSNHIQLLMPSIASAVSAVTETDLDEDDVALTDIQLSDDQKHFIELTEIFTLAEMDARLKHTQKCTEQGGPVELSESEKEELLKLPEAVNYYQAIKARYDFKRNGESLGALLQRLVDGLRDGDVEHGGQEYNAGASANEAILQFSEVYNSLSEEIRAWLDDLTFDGYYSFRRTWDILTVGQLQQIENINAQDYETEEARQQALERVHRDTSTCVQINSGRLRDIVNHHRERLYTTHVNSEAVQAGNIVSLDEAVFNARHWYQTRLLHLRQGKAFNEIELSKDQSERLPEAMLPYLNSKHMLAAIQPLLSVDRNISHVAAGGYSTFLMTVAGEVYACGCNEFGQLGLGDHANRKKPTKVELPEAVSQVSAGGDYTLFLTTAGEVYACGWNSDGQLGLGDDVDRSKPTKVELPEAVSQVIAGDWNTLFLTTAGEVYACGLNHAGQLGLGDDYDNRKKPTKVELPEAVSQVIVGVDRTFFVTAAGEVYACGRNYCGQLGVGDYDNRKKPTKVELPETVSQVSAGGHHTLFVTAAGEVYACGYSGFDQLGLGDDVNCSKPTKVELPEAVSQVIVGVDRTFFVTAAGEVYACGLNYSGELGLGDYDKRKKPTKVELPEAVSQVITGYDHTIFLTTAGEVYACGDNQSGQLGLGDETNRYNFSHQVMLPGQEVRKTLSSVLERMQQSVSAVNDVTMFGSNKQRRTKRKKRHRNNLRPRHN